MAVSARRICEPMQIGRSAWPRVALRATAAVGGPATLSSMGDLPQPDSDELRLLVAGGAARVIYRLLFEAGKRGLTMQELRRRAAPELATQDQEQLDRRKRDLHPLFIIVTRREGRDVRHVLVGRKRSARGAEAGISEKDRAIVLREGRCYMCGKTPREDGIKLQVDHIIPRSWGGTNHISNLQPLCEQCNRGKKDHLATFDEYADRARKAVGHEEPHMRIGELLIAFDGNWVPGDLVGAVASAKQYQEDWQKRTRELRELGWIIETRKRKDVSGRMMTDYRAAHWEPWPSGSIRAEISRRERMKKRPSGEAG